MLDILSSPIRSYLAQTLQYYLSKYIEGIHLEGLGIFGGDLVLNDLEIKRRVLLESLEIPPSFDFSRGFIRELRIHIPWTQLLSQPIEVKLYTIELILTPINGEEERCRSFSLPKSDRKIAEKKDLKFQEANLEEVKSSWLRGTLQRILSNITIQINNIVVKYEDPAIVLSLALGVLEIRSADDRTDWTVGFTDFSEQEICKRIDVRDLTIYLDQEQQSSKLLPGIGYELPILTRTCIAARARICMKKGKSIGERVRIFSGKQPEVLPSAFENLSVFKEPSRPNFQAQSRSIEPFVQLQIDIQKLSFSLSNRQLHMLSQLLQSRLMAHFTGRENPHQAHDEQIADLLPHLEVDPLFTDVDKYSETSSWTRWAFGMLRFDPIKDLTDPLVSELIAESESVLQTPYSNRTSRTDSESHAEASEHCISLRVRIGCGSITLRNHKLEEIDADSATKASVNIELEELIPVANVGLVRVSSLQKSKTRIQRSAIAFCTLSLEDIDFEMLLEKATYEMDTQMLDIAVQIREVKLLRDPHTCSDSILLSWGGGDVNVIVADCSCSLPSGERCIEWTVLERISEAMTAFLSDFEVAYSAKTFITKVQDAFAAENLDLHALSYSALHYRALFRTLQEIDSLFVGTEKKKEALKICILQKLAQWSLHECTRESSSAPISSELSRSHQAIAARIRLKSCQNMLINAEAESSEPFAPEWMIDVALGNLRGSIDWALCRSVNHFVSNLELPFRNDISAQEEPDLPVFNCLITWARASVNLPAGWNFILNDASYENARGDIVGFVAQLCLELGYSNAVETDVALRIEIVGLQLVWRSDEKTLWWNKAEVDVSTDVASAITRFTRMLSGAPYEISTPHSHTQINTRLFLVHGSVCLRTALTQGVESQCSLGCITILMHRRRSRMITVLHSGCLPINRKEIDTQGFLHISLACQKPILHQLHIAFLDRLLGESNEHDQGNLHCVDMRVKIAAIRGDLAALMRGIDTVQQVICAAKSLPFVPTDQPGTDQADKVECTGKIWRLHFELDSNGGELAMNRGIILHLPSIRARTKEPALSLNVDWEFSDLVLALRAFEGSAATIDGHIGSIQGFTASTSYFGGDPQNSDSATKIAVQCREVSVFLSKLKVFWLLRLPFLCRTGRSGSEESDAQALPQSSSLQIILDSVIVATESRAQSIAYRHVLKLQTAQIAFFAQNLRDKDQPRMLLDTRVEILDASLQEQRLKSFQSIKAGAFGVFEALDEHSFQRILLCLSFVDLNGIFQAIYNKSMNSNKAQTSFVEENAPLMAWRAIHHIKHLFLICKSREQDHSPVLESHFLLLRAEGNPKSLTPFVYAAFKNYTEASKADSQNVFAGHIEKFDIAITDEIVICVGSIFSASPCACRYCEMKRIVSKTEERVSAHWLQCDLAQAELFLESDGFRVIFLASAESLHQCVVLSSQEIFLRSSTWNDTWLQKLCLPSFTAPKMLHRQSYEPRISSMACRKLSFCISRLQGFVTVFDHSKLRNFEALVLHGEDLVLGPWQVLCEFSRATTSEPIQVCKITCSTLEISMQKKAYDAIYSRIWHIMNAVMYIHGITRQYKAQDEETEAEIPSNRNTTHIEASIHGINVWLDKTHVRLETIAVTHTHSGVLTLPTAYISFQREQGLEVIFGPLSDPNSWNNNVMGPAKTLISSRWSYCSTLHRCTASVEVLPFQLHLSISFLASMTHFFTAPKLPSQGSGKIESEAAVCLPQHSTMTLKLIFLPSIVSMAGLVQPMSTSPRIWLCTGPTTLSLASDPLELPIKDTEGDPYSFYPIPYLKFSLDMDQISIGVAASIPVLLIDSQAIESGTSTWSLFYSLLSAATLRNIESIMENLSLRLVGSYDRVIDLVPSTDQALETGFGQLKAQIEVHAEPFRLSEHTLLSFKALLEDWAIEKDIWQSTYPCDTADNGLEERDREKLHHQSRDDLKNLSRVVRQHRFPEIGELLISNTSYFESDDAKESDDGGMEALQDQQDDSENRWMAMYWQYPLQRRIRYIKANVISISSSTACPISNFSQFSVICCRLSYWDYNFGSYIPLLDFKAPIKIMDHDKAFPSQLSTPPLTFDPCAIASNRWRLSYRVSKTEEDLDWISLGRTLSQSLEIASELDMEAFPIISLDISTSQMTFCLSHYVHEIFSHDIFSCTFSDISLALHQFPSFAPTLMRVRSTFSGQITFSNIAQLTIVPFFSIEPSHTIVELSTEHGTIVSVLFGSCSILLSQTAILLCANVLEKLENLFQSQSFPQSQEQELLLPELRLKLINCTGERIFFAQLDTETEIELESDEIHAFSYTLKTSPPLFVVSFTDNKLVSEAFSIAKSGVYARTIPNIGTCWVCIKRNQLQTTLIFRASVSLYNRSPILLTIQLNDKQLRCEAHARAYRMLSSLDCIRFPSLNAKAIVPSSQFPSEMDRITEAHEIIELQQIESVSPLYIAFITQRKIRSCEDTRDQMASPRFTWLQIQALPAIQIQNDLCESIQITLQNIMEEPYCAKIDIGKSMDIISCTPLQDLQIEIALPKSTFSKAICALSSAKELVSYAFVEFGYRMTVESASARLQSSLKADALLRIAIQSNFVLINHSNKSLSVEIWDAGLRASARGSSGRVGPNETAVLACGSDSTSLAVRLMEEDCSSEYSETFLLALHAPAKLCRVPIRACFTSPYFIRLFQSSEGSAYSLEIRPAILAFNQTNLELQYAFGGTDHFQDAVHSFAPPIFEESASKKRKMKPNGLFRTFLHSPEKNSASSRTLCAFRVGISKSTLRSDPIEIDTNSLFSLKPSNAFLEPSNFVERKRLVLRDAQEFKHILLTYTVSSVENTIQILFFIDSTPSVVLQNQWNEPLAFSLASAPSSVASIGGKHLMDFAWTLLEMKADLEEIVMEMEGAAREFKLWCHEEAGKTQRYRDQSHNDVVCFLIGHPRLGWSQRIWQRQGIQFIQFPQCDTSTVFLVDCSFRAGTYFISFSCLQDKNAGILCSTAAEVPQKSRAEKYGLVVHFQTLSIHCVDEYELTEKAGCTFYKALLRVSISRLAFVLSAGANMPKRLIKDDKMGYLSHVKSISSLLLYFDQVQIENEAFDANLPIVLHMQRSNASLAALSLSQQYDRLLQLLTEKAEHDLEDVCSYVQVIYMHSYPAFHIGSYYYSLQVHLSPATVQFEDTILASISRFIRPVIDAVSMPAQAKKLSWSEQCLQKILITRQSLIYIDHFHISNIQVSITARTNIPFLESLHGTLFSLSAYEAHQILQLPDQFIKDLAANYVADTIMRSPMLLMSIGILGNPAGFVRLVSCGVRDFLQFPLHAIVTEGYNPWNVTKGIFAGTFSFLRYTSEATLQSFSGFTYSVSRTMENISLPPQALRNREHFRSTTLPSALRHGLGSIGNGVFGAATGIITTPVAAYNDRKLQGLDSGLSHIVAGISKGLVGVVARPVAGVATFFSETSEGIMYTTGIQRSIADSIHHYGRIEVIQSDALRIRLQIVHEMHGDLMIFCGAWIEPTEDAVSQCQAYMTGLEAIEITSLVVTVVLSCETLYIVSDIHSHEIVLLKFPLQAIQFIEDLDPNLNLSLGIQDQDENQTASCARLVWIHLKLSQKDMRELGKQMRRYIDRAYF